MTVSGFSTAGELRIGDVVDAVSTGSDICDPGAQRWHALRVAPQREDQASAWLRKRGVYAFHPVLMRRVASKGRVREYARRYLPGYVFACFTGAPVAHRIVGQCGIIGAVCAGDGNWGVLDPADLRALHAMRRIDAEAEALRRGARAAARRAVMLRPGGAAMFRSGPFAGVECEVVEIMAGDRSARVRLKIFGSEVLAMASCGDIVGLNRSG